MSDWLHTPDTDEVRRAATSFDRAWEDGGAAFDRWLEQVKAAAWEEGYTSGQFCGLSPMQHSNPYGATS